MSTTVLLIARLFLLKAEGTFFAEGYNRNLLWAHAGFNEIAARSSRPFIPQDHVIVAGATLVTVPFDF